MNVLFVYSFKDSYSARKPLNDLNALQFGISYISSFLKKKGHKTKLLILTQNTPSDFISSIIDKFSPSLICFTSVYSEYRFVADMAKIIKNKYPDIFLIAGGPHVSLNPEECLADSFDALCIGEGEEAVWELASQLEKKVKPSSIANLWIKKDGRVEKNPTRSFLQDIDILPFPDREMWEEWTENINSESQKILLGRGCPFLCSYCCNHALRKLASGKYIRHRSAESIIKEVEHVIKRYPRVKSISFEVETFTINTDWAIDLCRKLEKFNAGFFNPPTYGVNLRVTPNMQQLEFLLSAMEKANFDFVSVGLESGSERVRRDILGRNYSNENLLKAVALVKKHKLKVFLYVMVGLPGETAKDFKETINLTRRCLPDAYNLYIFFPYPGTKLYQVAKDNNWLPEELNFERERSRAVLDLPGFSSKQILSNYIWFEYNVYKGYKPLIKILMVVLNVKRVTSPRLDKFIKKLKTNAVFYKLATRIKNRL